mgnify:FL=1
MKVETKRNRYWIGCDGGCRTVFASKTVPTCATHFPPYKAVIGPFPRLWVARWAAENPYAFYSNGNDALLRVLGDRH